MRRSRMIAFRRQKVSELLAFGKNQAEIASILHVTPACISRDVSYIEGEARAKIADHVRKSVPHVYLICMRGLNEIIKRCWQIVDNTKNDYLRIHALTLLNNVYLQKQTLSTDSTILNSSLEALEQDRARVKALELGKVRPLKKMLEGEGKDTSFKMSDKEFDGTNQIMVESAEDADNEDGEEGRDIMEDDKEDNGGNSNE